MTPAMIRALLAGLSPEQLAEALEGMEDRLRSLLGSAMEEETVTVIPGRPLKDGLVFPMGVDGAPPSAADYRLPAERILPDTCVARLVHADERWSPKVYMETQCCAPPVPGSNICGECAVRSDKFHYNGGAPKTNGYSWNWFGRVTEEPPAWLHMLGTAWGVKRLAEDTLKWYPDGREAAAAARAEEKAVAKAEKAAAREAAKAEKAEEKAAAKAEKAVAKAEKAAVKEAAKAEKAAAKKPKATKEMSAGAASAHSVPEGKVVYVGDESDLYWQVGSNIYEYNWDFGGRGKFLGVLKADGKTIDRTAKPVKA